MTYPSYIPMRNIPFGPSSTPIDYNKVTIEEKKLMLDVLGPEEASKYAPSVERVNSTFAEQQQRWLEFREKRRAALDEMTKMSQEWGLYDEVENEENRPTEDEAGL